ALIVLSFKRVRIGEWLWLIAGAGLMLRLAKFAPMFALIAAPVLAVTLPAMSDRVLRKPLVAAAIAAVLAVALVRIALGFPSRTTPMDTWINRRGPALLAYPSAAANY